MALRHGLSRLLLLELRHPLENAMALRHGSLRSLLKIIRARGSGKRESPRRKAGASRDSAPD